MLSSSLLLSQYKYDIIKLTGGSWKMVKIENIIPNSTADKAGLKKEDKIITINGEEINDYIDYLYQISEPIIDLEIQDKDGKKEIVQLQRELGEELGIEFKEIVFDGLKQCKNNCVFCFVKQQPPNMRSSLNQKDDDYRFSFLQGSFITLTNLDKNEIQRIIEKNLSPINISVHTTNPDLRVEMMKNPRAAEINRLLKLLKKNNIQFHTQIVLCPDYNDKKELDRTLKDLLDFYPELLSIGIVPVGLTKHREGLAELRTLNNKEMNDSLKQIESWQKHAVNKYGENFIYAADEFYLNTNTELPDYEAYNDFPQLENGIGLTALMNEELKNLEIVDNLKCKKKIALITSELGAKSLAKLSAKLNEIKNLDHKLIKVKNNYFGESVTVTGLLTAQDIKDTIENFDPENYDKIFIPDIVLNDEQKFLDEVKKDEFINGLEEYKIEFVENIKKFVEVINHV